MTITTSITTRATSQGAVPVKNDQAKSGSSIQPVITPGLAATQRSAGFGRVPAEQPNVIDLIKECHRLNGNKEISDVLNSVIDDLANKVEAGDKQKAAEIKSLVVGIIKKADPVPASTVAATTPSSIASTTQATVAVNPSSATPQSRATTAGTWNWLGNLFGNLLGGFSKEKAIVDDLHQVAVKQGVLEQLVQYKKELQSVNQKDASKQKVAETISQIKAIPDLDSFKKVLSDAESSVKFLVKTTFAEKKSLVDSLRQTDLANRKQDKSIRDRQIQQSTIDALQARKGISASSDESIDPVSLTVRKVASKWSNKVVAQRAMHDAAIPGYKKLQSQFAESVQNFVGPVLEPGVTLNAAKLNALSERVIELEKLENDKLTGLLSEQEAANKAGDFEKLNTLVDQATVCEKNIDNVGKQKEKITELRRLVSAAAVDLGVIHDLSRQFSPTSSKANVLPFSLQMLGNGVESESVNEGFSLHKALQYGGSGSSNSAVSRSIALRIHLAEFGSDFNIYENSDNPTVDRVRGDRRSFLSDLGGALSSPDSQRANKTLEYLSTKEGRKYVHRLAACNVTAAGFNAKTLQLDAPSLAYKVESGFGSLKKLMIGRAGVYARDPGEYIGKRLSVLGRLSGTLQKELFRDGRPVGIDHAVLTPQHAVEASSLILAALPNDLLTVNHVEVTHFMLSLRDFEGEVQKAEEEKRSVNAETQHEFKRIIKEFHNTASTWVSKREASGAGESVAVASQVSLEIATNGRKGLFRRASSSLGNFINLAGGTAIREGWSSLQSYWSKINQKERLRQQFNRPENIALLANLKRQLSSLTESNNESDVRNAKALLAYLGGQSLTVEVTGELSPQLKKALIATGDFLQTVWQRLSKGKATPKVIGLTSLQTHSIPNYSKTNLGKFAAGMSTDTSVKPLTSTATSSIGSVVATSARGQSVVSGDQWISNLWGQVLTEGGNPAQQLARLKVEYQQAFVVDYPEGRAFSDQQAEAHFRNIESLIDIAAVAGQDVEKIDVNTLQKMKELAPILLKTRKGEALQGQLTPIKARSLQDVSGDQSRCWLRSSWGAAVHALSKDEFIKQVGRVAQSINNKSGDLNLNADEIREIYDQVKADPFNGTRANSNLESKQRAIMISLMDQADASWKKGNALETLNQLEKGGNPQAEGDFGVLFFKALGLPVIIHNGTDTIPDVYLPDNYKTDQHGHPDTWPTLRYDGTGSTGHWQFYMRPKPAIA